MPPKKAPEEEAAPVIGCDNHPGKPADLITTGDGRHSEIHLCNDCIPKRR